MRWMAWMSCWRKSGGNTGVKVPDLTEKSWACPERCSWLHKKVTKEAGP